jgi:hypothetical protein
MSEHEEPQPYPRGRKPPGSASTLRADCGQPASAAQNSPGSFEKVGTLEEDRRVVADDDPIDRAPLEHVGIQTIEQLNVRPGEVVDLAPRFSRR